MLKTKFKQIAEKENGKFYYLDKDIAIGGGVRSPNVNFIIKFEYKENQILINNSTGFTFVGKIYCNLKFQNQHAEFNLKTRSHFSSLFSRKKNRFIITCKNRNLNHFLENNIALRKLSQIAEKTSFSPSINGENNKSSYEIITKYHLRFSDWTQVIEPLIEFYKNLIDEFEKRNLNISFENYRSMK